MHRRFGRRTPPFVVPPVTSNRRDQPGVPEPLQRKHRMNLFPQNYNFEFRHVEGGDELVATVSPTHRPSFYRADFGRDVFYIGDNSGHYYTRSANVLATAISNFVQRSGYRKVVFVGVSKAGYGALLLAQLCSKLLRDCQFSAIAFSPQVQVYPRETSLTFPSYEVLIQKAKNDPLLMDDLERFGSLDSFTGENVTAEVYCGTYSQQDVDETKLLRGGNVDVHYIPLSTHLSHLPFVVDTRNAEALRSMIDRAYSQNATIEGESSKDVADRDFVEMSKLLHTPLLPEIVDIRFSRMPNRNSHQWFRRIASGRAGRRPDAV